MRNLGRFTFFNRFMLLFLKEQLLYKKQGVVFHFILQISLIDITGNLNTHTFPFFALHRACIDGKNGYYFEEAGT